MLTFGFTPLTQHSLYFSARSYPAGKKCSNFIQLEDHSFSLGLQLLWIFFLFFLTVICGFKSPLLGLISLRLKKKIYIAFRKIIPGVYYRTISSRFLSCSSVAVPGFPPPWPHAHYGCHLYRTVLSPVWDQASGFDKLQSSIHQAKWKEQHLRLNWGSIKNQHPLVIVDVRILLVTMWAGFTSCFQDSCFRQQVCGVLHFGRIQNPGWDAGQPVGVSEY